VPTPVGPADRDPNDPDFWDWDPPDDRPIGQRRPIVAIVAVVAIVAILLLLLVSIL
jgi:hypothetical protein